LHFLIWGGELGFLACVKYLFVYQAGILSSTFTKDYYAKLGIFKHYIFYQIKGDKEWKLSLPIPYPATSKVPILIPHLEE
jgi:hypothetical protein